MANSKQWMNFGEALMSFGAKMGALKNERERNESLARMEAEKVRMEGLRARNESVYQTGLLTNDAERTRVDKDYKTQSLDLEGKKLASQDKHQAAMLQVEREKLAEQRRAAQAGEGLDSRRVDLAVRTQEDDARTKAYLAALEERRLGNQQQSAESELMLKAFQQGIYRKPDGTWADNNGVLDQRQARELEKAWNAPDVQVTLFKEGGVQNGNTVIEDTPLLQRRQDREIEQIRAKGEAQAEAYQGMYGSGGRAGASSSGDIQLINRARGIVDADPTTANLPEHEKEKKAMEMAAAFKATNTTSRNANDRIKQLTARLKDVLNPPSDQEKAAIYAEMERLNDEAYRQGGTPNGGGGGGGTAFDLMFPNG